MDMNTTTSWRYSIITAYVATTLSLVALFNPVPASALSAFWETESELFTVPDLTCADGCHSIVDSNHIGIPDQEISSGATSVEVLPPEQGISYSWRYRKAQTSGKGQFLSDQSAIIGMPESLESLIIQYCVGVNSGKDKDETEIRHVYCDTFNIKREPQDEPVVYPVIANPAVDPIIPGIDPVLVLVPDPNQPPVAADDRFIFTNVSGTQQLDVLDNDSDPEKLALSIKLMSTVSQQGAQLQVVNNVIRYSLAKKLLAPDTFHYQARDKGGLLSAKATVQIVPSDQDGDGVFDAVDNCLLSPNPGQLDLDTDGMGAACDPDDDGDGQVGIGSPSADAGKALVEKDCLLCHQNPNIGAPQFGDSAAWQARLDVAGSLENLALSAINGMPGTSMPAFGAQYTAQELVEAVLYLSGISPATGGSTPEPVNDADGDLVPDSGDNCPQLPNPEQQDADQNGTGDICEPAADNDGDGYIFALDDDDNNANRLPGTSESTGSSTIFASDRTLSLGRIAKAAANPSIAGVLLNDSDFISAANQVFPLIQASADSGLRKGTQVMDIELDMVQATSGNLIIRLFGNLPVKPVLKVYKPATATWEIFSVDGSNRLASAPSISGECPAASSTNYSDGLQVGLACVRVDISDGGPNDSDQSPDGSLSMTARIGSPPDAVPGNDSPTVVNASPSKGGGSTDLLFLVLAGLFVMGSRGRPLNSN